jgi:diacylglycerol kinase
MNAKRLLRSFSYAIQGLKISVSLDQNVRFHLVAGTLVFIISLFLGVPKSELMFVVLAIFFVVITEMINTAIEEMTNLIKKEHSEEARIAKDVAAGAVLLSAIFAVIVGVVVIVPRLFDLL